MKRILVLALMSLAACRCTWGQRLPDTVVPENYDLALAPNVANATFSGEEVIHVTVNKPTTAVTLNSAELEFQRAMISAGGMQQNATTTFDPKSELHLPGSQRLLENGRDTVNACIELRHLQKNLSPIWRSRKRYSAER